MTGSVGKGEPSDDGGRSAERDGAVGEQRVGGAVGDEDDGGGVG